MEISWNIHGDGISQGATGTDGKTHSFEVVYQVSTPFGLYSHHHGHVIDDACFQQIFKSFIYAGNDHAIAHRHKHRIGNHLSKFVKQFE